MLNKMQIALSKSDENFNERILITRTHAEKGQPEAT